MPKKAGVEARTLRRAKESLGIKSQRRGFGKGSTFYWVLPNKNDLVGRLKQNELDSLLDKLLHGDDDTMPDEDAESDPADWWKQERPDDDQEPGANGEKN